MVEPAGRYARCLRSPPLSSVGPSTFQLDADHPSLSGLRGGDRLFPSGRRRSRMPSSDRFGPPNPGRFGIRSRGSSPETPTDDTQNDAGRPHRTTKEGRSSGSVRRRRYHRIVPLRTHVCRYGEYESSKITRWSDRTSRGAMGPTGRTARPSRTC